MTTTNITMQAWHAIKAAHLRKTCGRYAASCYAKKHGVSSLYRLACQLSATN
jgi:hypothetical protein